MDNKIYINLKKNLERKVVQKCFRDYGYIMQIYEILEYKDGIIEAENFMSSALFDVSFSCRLCRPLKNKEIICQIDRVNRVIVTATNGPILTIITNDRINDDIFFTDNNNNLRYKDKETDTSKILKEKEFVKVIIKSIVFNNGDDRIKAIGFLNGMATEKDVQEYYQELYNTDEKIVDFEKYMESEKESNNI
jgi:DNA-directed RNA polymerase subunit E'/Rpb7